MYFEKSITTATLQHWPAEARAASAAEHRRAVRAAGLDRRDDVVRVARDDDADRHLTVVGGVGGVQRAAARVEADLAANDAREVIRQRPRTRRRKAWWARRAHPGSLTDRRRACARTPAATVVRLRGS